MLHVKSLLAAGLLGLGLATSFAAQPASANEFRPDFTISATANKSTVLAGSDITYTLTVKNLGTTGGQVTFNAALPAGFTGRSVTPLQTGYDCDIHLFQDGVSCQHTGDYVLPAGATHTFVVNAKAGTQPGTRQLTATVDPGNDETEFNEQNNNTSLSTTVFPRLPGTIGTLGGN